MRSLSFALVLVLFLTGSVFAQQKHTHTVKAGETLYSISKTLKVSVAELKSWNKLVSNDLAVGQQLTYFVDGNDVQPPNGELPDEPVKSLIEISTPQENVYYTVKSGDNLTFIARRHNMSISELKELNNLESDMLRIGQRLSVRKVKDSVAPSAAEFSNESTPQGEFVVYTVESGDTFKKLLAKFNMSDIEMQELNPGVNLNSIRPGQKITVLLPPSKQFENPYKKGADLQNLGSVPAFKYSDDFTGNATTSGELYNPDRLTAAHSNIALGSVIYIENEATGKGIFVRINDRIMEAGLKLSSEAYRILDLEKSESPAVTIFTEN
ncbi:MAG TPA: hypothetical protein DEQ34_03400 [Balneolaceae bacterium]|nr:hypothetical protein [Balneolaceae bacterium]|tara:strand:- start:56312 stop:57283 length:972 start_codon:yes stop_codon:yes gene_type:complete